MTAPSTARTTVVTGPGTHDPDLVSAGGSRTWSLRGSNFVAELTELVGGDRLTEKDLPDEHLLLVPDGAHVDVEHGGLAAVPVQGAAAVVVPAGTSTVSARGTTTVLRVFTARCTAQAARAARHTAGADPRTAPLPRPSVAGDGTVRVHRLRDVPDDPGRLGRIFRTASLMVNWFPVQHGPRDTERLSPHAHDDFEQVTVTLTGDYAHHLRVPWTPRLSQWRDDEHVMVTSPSMTLIPPTVVHTTRAVGPGPHVLVDVFAPPREDFLASGWVLNADDYRRIPR